MSFKDELKKNMRTTEEVKKEQLTESLKDYQRILAHAEYEVNQLRQQLIANAQKAQYRIVDDKKIVSCIYELPYNYLRVRRGDNMNELIEDGKKFFLFRDRSLVYRSWDSYDIDPKYQADFQRRISAIKRVAEKDGISIDVVLYDPRDKGTLPFPNKVRSSAIYRLKLVIKASIEID